MRAMIILVLLGGVAAAQPARSPDELKQICVDALNADPVFAKSIAATVDKQIDQKTIDAHEDAFHHIQKNERHVIIAYAAMWVIAAVFLAFMWLRQKGLIAQIHQLKQDLEAAAKDGAK